MRNPFRRKKKNKAVNCVQDEKNQVQTSSDYRQIEGMDASCAIEGKLLVMGRESDFSQEVISYAVDMAKRMSFEILALNSAPLNNDAFSLFSTSKNKLCNEFKEISEKNAMAFRQAAEENGIPFTQIIKFDEPDTALSEVQREFGHIEFVISEPQSSQDVNRVSNQNRPQNEVLVYSMI